MVLVTPEGSFPYSQREGEELSLVHTCTVGWVRAFPHIDHDLLGRVWKEGFQGREPKTFLGTGAAAAALDHLHLPKAFEEQELLQVQPGRLTAGPPGAGTRGSHLQQHRTGPGARLGENTAWGTTSSISS